MTSHRFRCPACGTDVVVDSDGTATSDSNLKLAATFLAAGNLTAATEQLSKALESDPASRFAWFLRALATALTGVAEGEAYLDPYLDEASTYLDTAATTPEEAGSWLRQVLPRGPSRLADSLLQLAPSAPWKPVNPKRAVWGDFITVVADQLSAAAQRGGWKTRVIAIYMARHGRPDEAERILGEAANEGDRTVAALGFLDLAQLLGRENSKTSALIESALRLAGEQEENVLDWAGISREGLAGLGWIPPPEPPPATPPSSKRWWQS